METQTLANARSIFWGEGGSLGTDPRPRHKVAGDKSWENPNSAYWLGVSPRFQETPERRASLTLTLSFLHRAESEVSPRPGSPKVSGSPSEAATPAEDMARRSKLAVGREKGEEGAQGRGPMFSDSWRGQKSRWPRAQVCCLTLWVQIPDL